MEFQKWTAEQYRSADTGALSKRRDEIKKELRNKDSKLTTDELMEEVAALEDAERRAKAADELEKRSAMAAQQRSAAAAVAGGAGTVVTGAQALESAKAAQTGFSVTRSEDPFDTNAYHEAFFDYVMRDKPFPDGLVQPGTFPANVRADAFGKTTDTPSFSPTTLANQIISKMSEYGTIWPEVTKMSVQGGLEISVWDWLPTASWVTEAKASDAQKPTDATRISFLYHMLECKVAESILANAVSLQAFEAQYPAKCAEAMVRALEQAIVNGSGSGQPLGILKETRLTADNKATFAEADIATWKGWATILKKVTAPYRARGKFVMAQGTWDAYVDGMVDQNGQPIARVNYGISGAHSEQYSLMGKPVKIVPDDILPAYDDAKGQAADTPCILFMDLSNYIVNQQMGMRSVRWADEDTNVIKQKVQTIVDGKMGDVNGTLIISAPKKSM